MALNGPTFKATQSLLSSNTKLIISRRVKSALRNKEQKIFNPPDIKKMIDHIT